MPYKTLEQRSQHKREWRLRNPGKTAEYKRRLTPERRAEEREQYRLSHKPQRANISANYRARKASAFTEDVDRELVWARDEGICGICLGAADQSNWHLDHIQSLSRGGEHSYANTQVSHPLCNTRKGAND